ncbi:hypothetical protein J2Z69_002715 [Paenibacillus shirakamiensis]|uniref:YheC/YheD family protein n=1 Tax=Paenibacillus shirakamiensis TaxID=1265935 RepID=A0ABS4JKR5_9BACL|nr:YheC/YheD family protein [Paenibacillus shirakamiensis]MBP2001670.1 hypothetical protein [Paenibacillus shirakamiensis]
MTTGRKASIFLSSKWVKTQVLLQDPKGKRYVPDTRRFGSASLKSMLERYHMVYIKPERGTHGIGVIRAEQVREGKQRYKYQYNKITRTYETFDAFVTGLRGAIGGKSYLIQKGIHLLKYQGRRFDIRIMVQKSSTGKWETTGIIGRAAAPGKIVTNYHSGGRPMSIDLLLAAHVHGEKKKALIQELYRFGVTIAKVYQKKYPNFRQIGVDVGLDASLTPWIIEVNTSPDPYIFNQLKDKSMYRKVMSFRRAQRKVT